MHTTLRAAALCAALCATTAQAHITLEQKTAVAGTTYKAVFRVGHGCNGSPTTAISVFLPEGFVGAKPMPKAGWNLETRSEKLPQAYASHGRRIEDRVSQVTWSGGRLADAEYDEFVLVTTLPARTGLQRIRVLQTCEKGQNDWSAEKSGSDPQPPNPAPTLELTPAQVEHHHH